MLMTDMLVGHRFFPTTRRKALIWMRLFPPLHIFNRELYFQMRKTTPIYQFWLPILRGTNQLQEGIGEIELYNALNCQKVCLRET